ncbi:MAG: hypothetical protein ACK4VW_01805 [Anaerolineales bacterium]
MTAPPCSPLSLIWGAIRILFLGGFWLGLLAGCRSLQPSPPPRLLPTDLLPTVIAQTAEAAWRASWTPTPTVTLTSTATPVPLPSATPTLPPPFPTAQIQVLEPGPMSRVASPLVLKMRIFPADSMRANILLYGEDGRILNESNERFYAFSPRSGVYRVIRLPFNLSLVAERATLQISTATTHDIIQSLVTQRLLLLSAGENLITPPMPPFERLYLAVPASQATASGGILAAQGVYYPINTRPLHIELRAENGDLLAQQDIPIPSTELQPFALTLPYQVAENTKAWLVFSQEDDLLPIQAYGYARSLFLLP